MSDNIRDALALAFNALPQRFEASDVETYRVCLSADATAHCRELGLLTPTQFVCYSAWHKPDASWGPTSLHPSIRDEADPSVFWHGPPPAERRFVPVPVAEELRKEFLAIKDPHHLLARHNVTGPRIERPYPI